MSLTEWIILIIGWVISACGIGTIVSKAINKRIDTVSEQQNNQKERQNAVELGVQALLRANIISIYNKYMYKGEIPIYERENIEHLYTEYKALNGNGVIESLVEKLSDLPTPRQQEPKKEVHI